MSELEFGNLSPEKVLEAIESQGLRVDGRYIILNSYENRVYQVNLEDADPIIAKFYRPNRWTDESILEDHFFTQQLAEHELPVLTPWKNNREKTLFYFESFRFSIFRRQGGQAPEPGCLEQLYRLGGLLGRLHAIGKVKGFEHRATISIDSHCIQASDYLMNNHFLPADLEKPYDEIIRQITTKAEEAFHTVPGLTYIRTHGDFHLSNIIWSRDDSPWLLDFDDCCMAPAVQDLWMLFNGDDNDRALQLSEVLEGYEAFNDFNRAELKLIEPLRALRMIHYSAWLARRWYDPAFKKHFPWFNTEQYWRQHLTQLSNQLLEM